MRRIALSLARLRRWLCDPIFRHELRRRRGWLAAAGLAGLNLLYVAAFMAALILRHEARTSGGAAMSAQLDASPWLLAGAALLSLCAHWLVPPFLLAILCADYELRTLVLMVHGRHADEEVLRGQVAAGIAPLVLGALPLALAPVALALFGSRYLPQVAGALPAASLWGALCTSVSVWRAVRWRAPAPAGFWTYALTSLALPLAVGAISLALASGCSAGRPTNQREFVFAVAGGLTWVILVVGIAATFWDATFLHLFPDRRRPLWAETGPVERP